MGNPGRIGRTRLFRHLALLCASAAVVGGCATKGYRASVVREVGERLDALTGYNEELMERVRMLEAELARAVAAPPAPSVPPPPVLVQPAPSPSPDRPPFVPPISHSPSYPAVRLTVGRLSESAARGVIGAVAGLQDQLTDGHFGLQAPERMKVGEAGKVVLLVSLTKAAQQLRAALDAAVGPGSVRALASVKLSKFVEAKLTGGDFEIAGASSAGQLLSLDGDGRWEWEVRPKRAGTLPLTVTLTAVLQVEGMDRTKDVEVLSKEIVVEALPVPPLTWQGVAAKIWRDYKPPASFLWGTVFMAALGRLWNWRRSRRSRPVLPAAE